MTNSGRHGDGGSSRGGRRGNNRKNNRRVGETLNSHSSQTQKARSRRNKLLQQETGETAEAGSQGRC